MDAAPYEMHLFVCVNDHACIHDGPAVAIQKMLKAKVKEAGLKDRVRANKALCFSQCGHGPLLVVYPQGVWYAHLDLEGAERIWREHILGGRVVEDLAYRPVKPGGNAMPRLVDEARNLNVVDRANASFAPCSRCPPA